MSVQLKVSNCPAQELALTNCAFVAPADAPGLGPFVEIGASVLSVRPDARIECKSAG
jgi:vesicle-fusing ATPase